MCYHWISVISLKYPKVIVFNLMLTLELKCRFQDSNTSNKKHLYNVAFKYCDQIFKYTMFELILMFTAMQKHTHELISSFYCNFKFDGGIFHVLLMPMHMNGCCQICRRNQGISCSQGLNILKRTQGVKVTKLHYADPLHVLDPK